MVTNGTILTLEHIRGFDTPHAHPIRPLTLLVGENSTGKSTFLAIAACVFNQENFPSRPPFNEPPFSLGTYDTIATFKGGKYGRDESFNIGYSVGGNGTRNFRSVKATYQRDQGVPGLVSFESTSKFGNVDLHIDNQDKLSGKILLAAQDDFPEQEILIHHSAQAYTVFKQNFQSDSGLLLLIASDETNSITWRRDLFDQLVHLGRSMRPPFSGVVSLAPIRTKPKRTYDELSEDYSPEGDHIPKLLARLLNESPLSANAIRVKEALVQFGAESGLFKQIDVKKLGKGQDDPFQVQVSVGGPRVNLVDVGYGVSQALPVIVQNAIRQDNSLLLIQQPEVHLHPRAQAALGTFFANLVSHGKNTLVIETHSDFLVDRVRQEVAKGTLKPEQVQILFFHKEKMVNAVYPIDVDAQGNIVNAPEHYRNFFLDEEVKILQQGNT